MTKTEYIKIREKYNTLFQKEIKELQKRCTHNEKWHIYMLGIFPKRVMCRNCGLEWEVKNNDER